MLLLYRVNVGQSDVLDLPDSVDRQGAARGVVEALPGVVVGCRPQRAADHAGRHRVHAQGRELESKRLGEGVGRTAHRRSRTQPGPGRSLAQFYRHPDVITRELDIEPSVVVMVTRATGDPVIDSLMDHLRDAGEYLTGRTVAETHDATAR